MEFCDKAVIVKAFGSYNCLSVNNFPLESLIEKVEVQVYFCGLNFADLYMRQGLFSNRKLPFVLGIECAGVITAIGHIEKECKLKIGQRVICYDHNGGLFQDKIRISPNKVYPLPDDITFEVGAALFVNYLTAYYTLFDIGNLKPGETVFIQSCAGGVGFATAQLARTVNNIKIIGTASEFKEKIVKENGVDYVLSYNNLEEQINELFPDGLDLIIENQAGTMFSTLQGLLKPLGRIVCIGANNIICDDSRISVITLLKLWWNTKHIALTSLIANNAIVSGFHLGVLIEKEPLKVRKTLDVLFDLVRNAKIAPKIDSIWAIDEICAATKLLGERRNIGKVLLSINK